MGVLRVPAGAAADGSAWTTVLSKAGGATVRGRARWRASACACVHVRGGGAVLRQRRSAEQSDQRVRRTRPRAVRPLYYSRGTRL
jgi:hypothetical protein